MNLPFLQNRYRVLQVLSDRGGFGITYLAEDTQMPSGRRCVIKQLRPINSDPQLYQTIKERFQREAVILEQLGHNNPQIPELYAYFEDGGHFYLVEELIEGLTLTQKMQQEGKMSESGVRSLLSSMLPVIEYIHNYRIIHRDIKPDNIILRYGDNLPVLLDFGAVKETMGTVMTASGNITSSIVIGTAGFMPSEQSAGRPVFASDLYSLGLTAIYLLTGKLPQELNTDISTGEISWRQQALNVSPGLGNILDKVIRSYPRERYLNSREMLEALRTISNAQYNPQIPMSPVGNLIGNQIQPQPNSPIPNPQINPQVNTPVNPQAAQTQISQVGGNNKGSNNNYNPNYQNNPVNQQSPSQDNPTVIATPQQQANYPSPNQYPNQYPQYNQTAAPSGRSGLKDWQKAAIVGGIAGTFVLGAVLANNVINASKNRDNNTATTEQTSPIDSPPANSTATPTPTDTPTSNDKQDKPQSEPTPVSNVPPNDNNGGVDNNGNNPSNSNGNNSGSSEGKTQQPSGKPNNPTEGSKSSSGNASIAQNEALSVVQKWQNYKGKIMGKSHETGLGSEILTGKAYRENIQRDDGQESSSQWLRNNNAYYFYAIQQVDSVNSFTTDNDRAEIEVVVTEHRVLYKSNGTIDRKASAYDRRLVRYNLQNDNGTWKIADYNTVKLLWKGDIDDINYEELKNPGI